MTIFCLDTRVVQDHFPGIGRYAFNLARSLGPLLDDGEKLVLLRDPQTPSRSDLRTLQDERVTVVDAAVPIFSMRQHWKIPALLKRLGVSVYHSPYFVMPARPGVPTVVTIHDLIPLHSAASFGGLRKGIFQVSLRWALRSAAAILTPSRSAADELRRYIGSAEAHVVPILSAVDPSFRPQSREHVEQTLAKLRLPQRYVLYVGSNRPHKNLPRLIDAWTRVDWPDGPLVIAGPPDPDTPDASKRVEELALGSWVRFLGPVSEEELRCLYSGATLFVLPSESEGFGFPVVEAMSCGAAVACSNAGALAEVADGAAELFPPHDVGAIASLLSGLLGDASRRADLTRRGLQRAASLTWEATSSQVLEVYRKVARLTPSP